MGFETLELDQSKHRFHPSEAVSTLRVAEPARTLVYLTISKAVGCMVTRAILTVPTNVVIVHAHGGAIQRPACREDTHVFRAMS